MINKYITLTLGAFLFIAASCNQSANQNDSDDLQNGMQQVKLITLNPGHFHAALVQKTEYPEVDSLVHVYAPADDQDLQAHLGLIERYNTADSNATHWKEEVYTGSDFLQRMIDERKGNVVVLAGNNRDKTDYILKSVDAGLNVLADKPMAIDKNGFKTLLKAFSSAKEQNKLLYDIMTERFEITAVLQKELSQISALFGELETGTPEDPAITKESVHHFFKEVSGKPLIRPTWFFDVEQQGEGIVDVTTHLVDLVQWEGFPEQVIDYQKEIHMIEAKRWPTLLEKEEFKKATNQDLPDFLTPNLNDEGKLVVMSNGEINYQIKGVHAKVSVIWNFEAPVGTGDTHYSVMRGTSANLIIKQGEEQGYKPMLYIERVTRGEEGFDKKVEDAIEALKTQYAGLSAIKEKDGVYKVIIPANFITSHEEHFGQVTRNYLDYLKRGSLPDWEVPNMIAKYYITTQALEIAKRNSKLK